MINFDKILSFNRLTKFFFAEKPPTSTGLYATCGAWCGADENNEYPYFQYVKLHHAAHVWGIERQTGERLVWQAENGSQLLGMQASTS